MSTPERIISIDLTHLVEAALRGEEPPSPEDDDVAPYAH
ncbi:hypothetical protein BKA02_001145 [Microbacterium pseudoresistens]|uniref:Uncharacterized protein n=1 Tax=Microbacterium pseudoresistens TaxID=640634 RepID=A0A7Y9EUA8_9MICO|nr:hypothetical protein [Microbacterium pseudoresistens]